MAGLKKSKTSISAYLGTTPQEQPVIAKTEVNELDQNTSNKDIKTAKPQRRKTAVSNKLNTHVTNASKASIREKDEKRRINFRVYHIADGVSPTFDKYVEGEDEKFAMKTIITDAIDQWVENVNNGSDIEKNAEYKKGIATYQTTRIIPQDVYDKACEIIDPFSKKTEHTIATSIAVAAIHEFIKQDS